MSRNEIAMMQDRDNKLDELIRKFGFESEPVLYFAKWAWEDIYNMNHFFEIAINWVFNWDE